MEHKTKPPPNLHFPENWFEIETLKGTSPFIFKLQLEMIGTIYNFWRVNTGCGACPPKDPVGPEEL